MQRALLGVDVGTSNTKAVAFGLDGSVVTSVTRPTPTLTPRAGWVEYDVDALWAQICEMLRELIRTLPADTECAAIAFTGMAEAGVALDRSGKVRSHAISWLDGRTVDELASWTSLIGAGKTARITGLPMSTAAGVLRLLWLRTHEPDTFAATQRWLNLPDYCAYRLCGVPATDYSLASRMMTLDLKTKQWSDDLCNAIDISPTLFGECVPSGTTLGDVTAEASELTGLPTGLRVVSGGHDHVCAALALGLTEGGDMLDSIGTAEAMLVTLQEPRLDEEAAAKGIAQGIHVAPDRYYAMSGLFYGGGSIDWVRSVLLDAENDDANFDQLLEHASAIPVSANNPYFLAHLRQANPPLFDPASRAAFVGLSSDHTAAHMARAVIEGLASEYHRLYESVLDAFSIEPQRLTATGGGTRIRLLLETKAALAGKQIEVPNVDEATALGAAVLAGFGSGAYASMDDAHEQIQFSSTPYNANTSDRDVHQRRYRDVYRGLYDALKHTNQSINAN